MNYTYSWQSQPKIAWKGPSTNSVTPSWSRPFNNGGNDGIWTSNKGYQQFPLDDSTGTGFWGKPRPLKQWRKQLNPRLPSIKGESLGQKKGIGMPMDKPGGSVYLGADSELCFLKDCSNSYTLKENLAKNPALQIIKPTNEDSFYDKIQNKPVCVACNPENQIIKSKVQPLKEAYTEYSVYLQSRVKKYEQRAGRGVSVVDNGVYFDISGQPLYPQNEVAGPPEYIYADSGMVAQRCATKNNTINLTTSVPYIYKPSNKQFAVQGAVSGASRIARLKENTINRNYANTQTANGLKNVNYGVLNMNAGSGFFMKVKPTTYCKPYKPSGSHTICWTTPTGSVAGRIGRNKP
jgi:hypothetical protein